MAYRGSVIRLPVGLLGFSGSRNPTQIQAGQFQNVEGVILDGALIQKEGGATKLNAGALGAPSTILAGISYSPLASINRDAVFLANGSILKDTSGTGTFTVTLASGLNTATAPQPYFMMGGGEAAGSPRTLFLFSSTNQVRAVDADGAVMAAITTPPADWAGAGNFPTFGVLHEGRLFGGGNASDPHRMYYSKASDHQDFASPGGTLSVFPGEGERIVGAVSFKGMLIIFKYPRGIYILTTQDPSPAGWRVDRLTNAVGSVNQHCIIPIDNDILYLGADGSINLVSTTNAFGDAESSAIGEGSYIAEFMRTSVNLAALRGAVGVWHSVKNQAYFALPGIGSTDNTLKLTVDFSVKQIGPRFLLSERDAPFCFWTRPDSTRGSTPVFGGAGGFAFIMDQAARNKDGVAYEFSFETANMDLSFADPKLATLNKSGDFLEIIFEPQGDWELTVQVVWDDVPGPPLLYSMGGSGAPLGVFILGTDILSSTSIRSIRKRIAGSGRRVRIIANNVGLNQNVAISDFYLSFRTMDERSRSNA